MNDSKLDRRIKYTRTVLKDSLVRLLQEKPISKISIKEICDRADINRTTFYAHYSDQYDLLHQIEQEVIEDLNAYLRDFDIHADEEESLLVINRIFDYIAENKDLCGVLLGDNGDEELQNGMMLTIQKHMLKWWEDINTIDVETLDYLNIFATNASIGIVKKWLHDGMKKPSTEISEMIMKMAYKGISAFV